MMNTEQIFKGIKEALIEGKSTVNFSEKAEINEASALTGSGLDVGGRNFFDDATAALRYANPFRQGSRQIVAKGSAVQFVAKTGNATSATNPFGYIVNANSGSPDISTVYWQLPMRVISAQLPIRSAALDDVNGLEMAVANDLILEFSAIEAASMALNNDQTGTSTDTIGGESGLRGFVVYGTGTTASYGSSGTAMTDGIHTIATVTQAGSSVAYNDVVEIVNSLPAQYWPLEGTAWHIHPQMILQLRELTSSSTGIPLFLEVGDEDGGAVANIFGFPVVPNPYLAAPGAGNISMVLANWDRFITIADGEEMTIELLEQTQPGTVTIYAEKRVATTIRDPFAGVFFVGA